MVGNDSTRPPAMPVNVNRPPMPMTTTRPPAIPASNSFSPSLNPSRFTPNGIPQTAQSNQVQGNANQQNTRPGSVRPPSAARLPSKPIMAPSDI